MFKVRKGNKKLRELRQVHVLREQGAHKAETEHREGSVYRLKLLAVYHGAVYVEVQLPL